ncbi:MAG: hypothetical protein ACK56W_12425 [Pirellula sp.]
MASHALAQNPSKADVVRAIEALSGQDVVLSGAIDQESPKADEPGIPGVVIHKVVIGGGDGSGREFTGDVDVVIYKDGRIALASNGTLPGMKVYKSGELTLCNQTHIEEPMDPKRLLESLHRLCDWKSLAKSVSESTKIRVINQGATTDVRVVLNSEYLKTNNDPVAPGAVGGGAFGGANGGGGAVRVQLGGSPMTPSVVDLIVTFQFNSATELAGLTYEIQYDDPMNAMMAKAMKGGGGVFRIQGNAAKPATDEEVTLGKMYRFDFDIQKKVPARIEAFAKEAEELLSKK